MEQGDLLMELDGTMLDSQLDQEQQRAYGLMARVERLQAEIDGTDLSVQPRSGRAAPGCRQVRDRALPRTAGRIAGGDRHSRTPAPATPAGIRGGARRPPDRAGDPRRARRRARHDGAAGRARDGARHDAAVAAPLGGGMARARGARGRVAHAAAIGARRDRRPDRGAAQPLSQRRPHRSGHRHGGARRAETRPARAAEPRGAVAAARAGARHRQPHPQPDRGRDGAARARS